MKIFLSGGTQGDWRSKVTTVLRKHDAHLEFFDPRALSGEEMEAIARTELNWLSQCSLLFFYLESDNPSGLGSAFEVGYCVASGIPVIFIDERRNAHTQWLAVHCFKTVHTLEEGLTALLQWLDAGK